MRRFAVSIVSVVFLVASAALGAHHSYSQFDLNRIESIQGTIDTIAFANPHVVLTIRTKDAVMYTATWAAALQLHRQGVNSTDLKAGDIVVISGNPTRNPAAHHLSKLTEVRRLRDGWAWKRMEDGQVRVIASR